MSRPGEPRWFERVPSYARSAFALPFLLFGWLAGDAEPEDLGGEE